MIKSKTRLFALVITILCLSADVYLWYVAISEEIYYGTASFFIPFIGCLIFSLVINPFIQKDNLRNYGRTKIQFQDIPLSLILGFVIGIMLGIFQCAYFILTISFK